MVRRTRPGSMVFSGSDAKTGTGQPLMQLAVWLIERPRWFKRTLLIINDLAMLTIALWLAYSLRLSQLYVPDDLPKVLLMAAAPVIGVAVFYMRGLYKLVTRFIGPRARPASISRWSSRRAVGPHGVDDGVKVHPRSVIVILRPDRRGPHSLEPAMGGLALLRPRRNTEGR